MTDFNLLYNSIVSGKLELSQEIATEAIIHGTDPQVIINNYMIKAMEEVGRRFEQGKAFVPDLLMAARAMKGALEILSPDQKEERCFEGKVIIGTVKGDLHDIGKNLVASMLEGCGFEVINLGVDISSERFIEAQKEHNADIICMSALLTTTMTYMEQVINDLNNCGLHESVKIMVGGAPVSSEFAARIGADGYSDNANSAVKKAKELIGK